MQLDIAFLTNTITRVRATHRRSSLEVLQLVVLAFNISGVAGSLFTVAGLLAVAARRGLLLAMHQES
jgi:hypothetical protein